MGCVTEVEKGIPYQWVKNGCALGITVLSLQAAPERLLLSAIAGVVYNVLRETAIFNPYLPKLSGRACSKGCASGCTDIVALVFGRQLDARLSLVIATLFFCCHLDHHAAGMVPVVGGILGDWIHASIF